MYAVALCWPLARHNCLLGTPVCLGKGCVVGGRMAAVNQQAREHLSGMRISQLSEIEWKTNSDTPTEDNHDVC